MPGRGLMYGLDWSSAESVGGLSGGLVGAGGFDLIERAAKRLVAEHRALEPGGTDLGDEGIDVLARRVDVEAGAGRCREVEALVERHRAVVARPDGDARPIKDLGDIVGMDARQVERHDATTVFGRWPIQNQLGNLARQ